MNHFVPTLENNAVSGDRSGESNFKPTCPWLSEHELRDIELGLSGDVESDSSRGIYRNQILNRMSSLEGGSVFVVEGQRVTRLGRQDAFNDGLQSTIRVLDSNFYRRIFWGGTIGSAESYMRGEWACDDLTSLIETMIINLGKFNRLEKTWAYFKNRLHYLKHLFRRNTVAGSRRNIHDHYDLGNDFYELFLDPTMNYSSGIFETADRDGADQKSMQMASFIKMEEIARRLNVTESDHVLEIGTGWGGLAMHLAEHYGCRVTTCTISNEQFRMAQERVRNAGLDNLVEVKLCDYRNLTGAYDKIVSIEMIEAVGHQYYDEYFRKCSSLLKPGGRLLLQAITIGEQIYEQHIRKVDFIRKYVFPGGCLPAISALSRSVGRVTDMRMIHQRDITPHYVKTLKYWRVQFLAKLEAVRTLGYDEQFVRLWHFYLCYCEAAFAQRRVHCVHLAYAKPGDPA